MTHWPIPIYPWSQLANTRQIHDKTPVRPGVDGIRGEDRLREEERRRRHPLHVVPMYGKDGHHGARTNDIAIIADDQRLVRRVAPDAPAVL